MPRRYRKTEPRQNGRVGKSRFIIPLVVVAFAAGVAAYASSHPDSEKQSIEDGCTRNQLGLLADAVATKRLGAHVTAAPSWVYVDGDNAPKTLEGRVLST